MEGKGVRAVIMGVLILGLVVAQIQAKSCCRNTTARNCYNICRAGGGSQTVCARACDCIHITGTTCPSSHPRSNMLESSDDVIEQVTTEDLKASCHHKVLCPNPEAQSCFDACPIWPEIWCVNRCGCKCSPHAI